MQKMASNSYVFQIELAETEGTPSAALAAGRLPAIIVEVRPEGLRQAGVAGPSATKQSGVRRNRWLELRRPKRWVTLFHREASLCI
jgi:hypothetical protein